MSRLKTFTGSTDHLRWVIFLLGIAVILPTVCLLWFMMHAAENETLALRQKMVNNYEGRLRELADARLGSKEINRRTTFDLSDGFCIYDCNGKLFFPVNDHYNMPDSGDLFEQAFKLEYKDKDLAKAVLEYLEISRASDSNDLAIKADISVMRCLKNLDHDDKAIRHAETVIGKYNDCTKHIRSQKCHAHMLLMELYKDKYQISLAQGQDHKQPETEYTQVLSSAFDYITQGLYPDNELPFAGGGSTAKLFLPTSLQLFALDRLINYAGDIDRHEKLNKKYKTAKKLLPKIETSVLFAGRYPGPEFVKGNVINSPIFRLKGAKKFYGNYRVIKGFTYFMIYSAEHVSGWFDEVVSNIEDEMVFCRVYDNRGELIAGTERVYAGKEINLGRKFSTLEIEGYFQGWKLDLYFHSGTFSNAAKRRRIIYLTTGTLVILLIGSAASLAARGLLKQARLNTLKNDFIATVTHELKTPLASMRVLVDTLLEGNYNDRLQAQEYLQLISKENKRLTGLIDNFLTFSRMERNKRAFYIAPCSAENIAIDAAEAMKTRFSSNDCKFSLNIAESIPQVIADSDAMVTVLVNLLENAFKYSGNEKKISLEVFADNGQICYQVSDNGIGIPGRIVRRIFERFYQADSRLSRSAEGCGLGLSIVKFIVDAHGGSVHVESRPGKGSVFKVILPGAHK